MSSERSARPGSRETSHSLNTFVSVVGSEDGCLQSESFVPKAGRPRVVSILQLAWFGGRVGVFIEKHSSRKQGDLAQRWHSPRRSSSDRMTAVLKEVAGQESFI